LLFLQIIFTRKNLLKPGLQPSLRTLQLKSKNKKTEFLTYIKLSN
jgi:hypothetical protein